ncbi:RHS repeat-associated core domain-containing protein [Streptococcus respiraculi]|uniref:RHS repeat-associated core domain-containing protein n=1 Tax=Streptococcus respiraculi TaxID=2021971 RepID=UPI001F0C2376|nr:RHS repeat-associated core domain-containing protein [Streptococcus respiraculi]
MVLLSGSITNGNGKVTKYTYDQLSNVVKRMTSLGDTETYTYNINNQLEKVTKADGKTISYDYNKLDQLLKVDYSEKQDGQVLYTYDSDGRRVSMSDLTGTTNYVYNDEGETLVHSYTYDTLGQVETMTVATKDGKELSRLSYTYDLAGNKLTSTETVDGKEEKTSFSYDDHNRLTKLEGPEGTITYTYDKNGNRISQETKNEKLAYIYDTENRLLAVKDKDGLLMAALYDGDDNRVFTASRKEGKDTYQLFRRKEKKKSPQTSPNGEEPSLFWYGFSQNVLQALSSFPQTVGSIWHHIFDDVSSAYHQKVAKDKATKDGLVVNPPSLGNLPGEGDVTYASQVKDVLIPYTTREDTYKYYEERNYVNDVNRKHTEVLQTYDHDLKARETYSYGHGRTSYLNNQTNKSYQYLTNQSGSVTGLTQDGKAVASSSYKLYGSTNKSTDDTGNPYAYNGEARDSTGLDYLRARYYDSHAGTFLTEDSYQGEATDPLSQNRYAYVHNNPVNYTDPSGHFWKSLKKAASAAWNGVKKAASSSWNTVKTVASNTWNAVKSAASHAVNWVSNKVSQAANWVGTQVNKAKNWVVQQWNNFQQTAHQTYQSARQYVAQQQAQAQAQAEARRQQHIRDEYTQATGLKTTPKTREGGNLFRNWGKALQKMYKHVCTTAKRIKNDTVKFLKKVDWKKVGIAVVATVAAVAVTVATAGAAGPLIAAGVSGLGLSGTAATIATAAAVGAVSGAAGGAVSGFTTSVLSGDKPKDILANTWNGAVNGFVSGGATGGLLGGFGAATSSVTNPVARYAVDTLGETAVDTITDVAQGGKITPASIATSLAINAVSEGVSARGVKGAKADVSAGTVTKPVSSETAEDIRRRVLSNVEDSRKARNSSNFDEHLRREQTIKAIQNVENGTTPLTNNHQKGNYGELKMDRYMEERGFTRVSKDRVSSIDDKGQQGIDGVYYNKNTDTYVVAEAKYNTAQLATLADGTKQMSDQWIQNRLFNSVGNLKDNISSYDKLLVRVMPNGNVISKQLP